MKTANMKGMVLGVALGVTGAVSAATPAAQVYDVCLSLRTTSAAVGTVNNKTNPIAMSWDDSESIVYRKPTNVEWRGLIWGCDCESADGVWEEVNEVMGFSTVKGCILWDTQTGKPVFMGNGADLSDVESVPGCGFGWDFVNAIGRGGDEVEGVWTMEQSGLVCDDCCQLYELHGSGFGRLQLNTCDDEVDCTSHILYMIGKVSGWMRAPTAEIDADWSGCTFCGYDMREGSCEFATAWAWGEFWDSESWTDFDVDRTAVHGTWTLKYNEELSQKLGQPIKSGKGGISGIVLSIRDVYNFADLPNVAMAIDSVEKIITGYVSSECMEAEEALAAATKAYSLALAASVQAEQDYFQAIEIQIDVTDAALWADYIAASNALALEAKKTPALQAALKTAKNNMQNAYVEMTNAVAMANRAWSVEYTDTTIVRGIGATNLWNELDKSTRTPDADGIAYATNIVAEAKYWSDKMTAKTYLKGLQATAEAKTQAYNAKVEAVGIAERALDENTREVQSKVIAKTEAFQKYNNRRELQKAAAVHVAASKLAYDAAQEYLTTTAKVKTAAEIAYKQACSD